VAYPAFAWSLRPNAWTTFSTAANSGFPSGERGGTDSSESELQQEKWLQFKKNDYKEDHCEKKHYEMLFTGI
jgi:hypothetical protein